MRIVIDLQGAQTESRFRGIGRYSLSIAKAIAQNRNDHEILIALSGLFPDTIEPIRAAFDGLLPQENLRVWYAPGPVRECQPGNEGRRQVAELIREAFLSSLMPDVILVTSLFEGYVDDAVTSIGAFDKETPVAVIAYDLIPYLNPDAYLTPNPTYKDHYLRKIEYLKNAKLYLSNSESTKKELIDALGINPDSITTIYAGIDDRFRKIDISFSEKERIYKKFGIKKDFIMYTGTGEASINQEGLIKAYAKLPLELKKQNQLVFVAKFDVREIKKYKDLTKSEGLQESDVIFTGYVSDEELVVLYNLCKLYVFPSMHEGFGLPALEAMACGAATIGSNRTSIPEVIGRDDALFDPYNIKSIADKIEQVLTNEDFRSDLKRHGLEQAKKFSWENSARAAIEAIERFYKSRKINDRNMSIPARSQRLKLAYVSPLPPEKSGIADYSAELLPELSKYYDIDVVVAQNKVSDSWTRENLPIRDVKWFCENAHNFDRILYHFGNSPFHSHMFDLLTKFSGVVVLHDFFLSDVQAYDEVNNIRPFSWVQSLYESHGYKAVYERFNSTNQTNIVFKYPCNLGVL
ncbi:MAG: glycosyltransferase [Dissulfurimicrobium sp.]|uniref:glycosyltransferase n=2 Tax=Bacteria TaxID=2 RepID=UPI00404A2FED